MQKEVYVIDLFCGCGGFSTGARQAGAKVILAVDCWKEALAVHEANHPETEHICTTLGGDLDEFASFLTGFIDLNVPSGGHVHLHASPPCQNLSTVNPLRNIAVGTNLVSWTLALITTTQKYIHTWSLEQVPHKQLMSLVDQYKGIVARMEDFGIPQRRKRLFLGSLDWDSIYKNRNTSNSVATILQVMETVQYKVPNTNYVIIYGSMKRCKEKKIIRHPNGLPVYHSYGLDSVCSTVTQCNPCMYDESLCKRFPFPLKVVAALQTFPLKYNFLSFGDTLSRKLIGNSIPPKFSKVLISSLTLRYPSD